MGTFRRLLGFLAPYRGQVIITAVLAAGTQAAGLLIPYLTGKVIDAAQAGDPRSQIYTYSLLIIASGVVKGVLMLFRRWLAGRLSLAVEYDLRNAHVRPHAAALLPLLRPPPDRPADVARDRRRSGRAGVPRLRPDLLLPARVHCGQRAGGDDADERAADADRARDHAGAGLHGLPLLAGQPPGAEGGAAAGRRRHRASRGERGRRARGEGLCPGAERVRPLSRQLGADLPPGARARPACRPPTCRP